MGKYKGHYQGCQCVPAQTTTLQNIQGNESMIVQF